MTQSSSQFLNILVPWCQAGHMVCKAVFQVLSSAIDHVLLNNNLIVPCALLKESREKERGCHHTSTQSKRILPIQTTKGHDFPLAVALLISYFYICFLWQFFFFFLLKRCGNFSSDATGNRELFQWQQILVFQYCITAARSWLLTRDHDKWLEAPRGEWSPLSSPKSSPNPPQCLPRVETGWGQMFWILDIRMEKCTVVNLDGEKKIMPYWYRNNLNYSSFLHMHLSTYEYMYVQASMQWHHYSNVSHYLVSFHSHHLLQQGSGGE